MRWIVITLIVINAAYFVWQQQFAAVPVVESASHTSAEKQLWLAAEVALPAAAPDVAPSPPAVIRSNNHNGEQHPAVPPPPAAAKTERLAAPAAEQPQPQPQPQPPLRACYSIGPFLLVNDVSSAAKLFEGVDGVATQQRAAAERSQVGYWVYIPPLDTLQAARAVLRDLQNREIREVLIISEGEKANAISAGVYNVEAQAQVRRDSISVLGYKTTIDPLYRTQPQYWLDVELMKSQTIPAKLWQKVSKNFSGITQTERPCE